MLADIHVHLVNKAYHNWYVNMCMIQCICPAPEGIRNPDIRISEERHVEIDGLNRWWKVKGESEREGNWEVKLSAKMKNLLQTPKQVLKLEPSDNVADALSLELPKRVFVPFDLQIKKTLASSHWLFKFSCILFRIVHTLCADGHKWSCDSLTHTHDGKPNLHGCVSRDKEHQISPVFLTGYDLRSSL